MEIELTILDHCAHETRFVVTALPALVGRGDEADVQLDDPWMSRFHCIFNECGGLLLVRDLGSRNGIFINGERITEARVFSGDRLTLGLTKVTIQYRPPLCADAPPGSTVVSASLATPDGTLGSAVTTPAVRP